MFYKILISFLLGLLSACSTPHRAEFKSNNSIYRNGYTSNFLIVAEEDCYLNSNGTSNCTFLQSINPHYDLEVREKFIIGYCPRPIGGTFDENYHCEIPKGTWYIILNVIVL